MRDIAFRAPAKINLYLKVLGRRGDGYHEIRSIFQAVSLEDRLIFRSPGGGDTVELAGPFGFAPERNLIVRAARAFQAFTGIRRGVRIEAEKRIPMGAGLGGGSSDAACTLAALNRLWEAGLDPAALHALAEGLGSDVPFFLHGPAAIVEGRGERIHPIAPRTDFRLLLVVPDFPVPTAEAYRWLGMAAHGAEAHTAGPTGPELEVMYREVPVQGWSLENSFDPVVESRFPVVGRIRRLLTEQGAVHAGLSGSGSAVFGLFAAESEAEAAAGVLSACNCFSRIVTPLAQTAWQ